MKNIDWSKLGFHYTEPDYIVRSAYHNGAWEEPYATKDKFLHLTDKGMEIAEKIYTKHKRLSEIFIALGVDEETARQDAHRIEHDLSDETFDAICRYTNLHLKKIEKACRQFCKNPRPECA